MKSKHLIIFAIISLAILVPLINGKYVLTLDTIISPTAMHGGKSIQDFIYGIWLNRPNAGELGISASGIPLSILSIFLKSLIPTFILQKIEIFLIFFLSMLSMYNLIQTKKQIPKYFGAFLYAINPFTYTRFMAGHWCILLGYAVLPFLVKELLREDKKIKNIVLWLSLISILSTHILAMSFLVLLIFIKKGELKKYAVIVVLFIILNLYWLYPALTAKTTTITTINQDDITAFITKSHFINILITNAMMYGFWRAKAYLIPSMYILVPFFAILLYLVVHGSLYGKIKQKNRFIILALISLVIAVGVAHPYFENIFLFLFKNIPFMRGFREPNKFIALLTLSYCVLSAYGLGQIKKKAVFLILPFLYTPLLFALNLQLKPIDYPADYYEVNNLLNKDKEEFNVLFLPWHLYLDFRWIENRDRRIANPAGIFFDKPVIKGDNMELYPIYSHSLNPVSKYVEENLDSAKNLSLINVRYILIAKEYNISMNDTTKIIETENLILLKNNKETYKFLQSDDLERFYKLNYRKKSAISYEVRADMKYIIFAEGYNANWRLDKQKPIKGYPVNIYLNNGNNLRYVIGKIILMYLVSLVAFFGLLFGKPLS